MSEKCEEDGKEDGSSGSLALPHSNSSVTFVTPPKCLNRPPNVINAFSRLQVSTNLNRPPSNWLHPHPSGADMLRGFGVGPQSSGFASFRMAGNFVEYLGDVDVVSDAENIKKLLKMAFCKEPVSLVVHRVAGKTLLIDEFDLHGFLLRCSQKEWRWLKEFFVENVLRYFEQKDKALVKKNLNRDERSLMSKFLYRSLMSETKNVVSALQNTEATTSGRRGEAAKSDTKTVERLPPLPEPSVEEKLRDPKVGSHEFARNLVWNFEDIRMLIGSDMPIFGDADHPSVSLRLRNSEKPINILTGMDYWLDNLMCQIPEVLMCYHLDGIVQKYELIKTEELPNLEGSKFSPTVVRDVAKNILSFLKTNAAKEGHTYWLFKGKDDEVVKLYDLTSLYAEASKCTKSNFENAKNPFQTAVAVLQYKLARNILQGKGRSKEEGTVRNLLENCLKLLDSEKFPHIAISANYMLAELFISDDLDPLNPEFSSDLVKSPKASSKSPSAKGSAGKTDPVKIIDVETLFTPMNGRIPPGDFGEDAVPLPTNVKQRCALALKHIVLGLDFLNTMSEKAKEEEEESKKRKEQMERDNIKVARPNEPIPMPFEDPNRKQVQVYEEKSTPAFINESVLESRPTKEKERTWDEHLQVLLMKKAVFVYVILCQNSYDLGQFGTSLRQAKRALNCYKLVCAVDRLKDNEMDDILCYAYSIAGKSYFFLSQTWNKIVTYTEQYNAVVSQDESLIDLAVTRTVEEQLREWIIKLPIDTYEALQLSEKCLTVALSVAKKIKLQADVDNLSQSIGFVKNELGTIYMEVALSNIEKLQKDENGKGADMEFGLPEEIKNVFELSRQYYEDGIELFSSASDTANMALLRSNLGRLFRIVALKVKPKSNQTSTDQSITDFELSCYTDAIKHYKSALDVLGGRKKNPGVFDKVDKEMAGAQMLLGMRITCNLPHTHLSQEHSRLALECLDSCRKHFENSVVLSDLVNASNVYTHLGLLYDDGARMEEKVSKRQHLKKLSETSFSKAFNYLKQAEAFPEAIQFQVTRILQSEWWLEEFKEASNASKLKQLRYMIEMMVETLPVFELINNQKPDVTEEFTCTLKEYLKQIQSMLLKLNKQLASGGKKQPEWSKKLYSCAVTTDPNSGDLMQKIVELIKRIERDAKGKLK